MASEGPRRRNLAAHLKKRSTAGGARLPAANSAAEGPAGRMEPAAIDAAWRELLQETLPADKQEALMETYEAETDPQTRYNMLLEFSSYLRQGAEADDPDDKYSLKPGRGHLSGAGGGRPRSFDDDDDANLCWEIVRVLLIVGGILLGVVGLAWYVGSASSGQPSILPHMAMGRDFQEPSTTHMDDDAD